MRLLAAADRGETDGELSISRQEYLLASMLIWGKVLAHPLALRKEDWLEILPSISNWKDLVISEVGGW